MTGDEVDHRRLGVDLFNAAWELIERADRSPDDDRLMVATAMASLVHWRRAGGSAANLCVGEWQVAHTASLAGLGDTATTYAAAAYDRARSAGLATWLQASTAEGRARAAATNGDAASYDRYAAEARELLTRVDDDEERQLIESQLATIAQSPGGDAEPSPAGD